MALHSRGFGLRLMTFDTSPNTQAILLLTAPLILGRSAEKEPLLSPREYGALARALKDAQCAPADLIDGGVSAAREAAERVVTNKRLDGLLARGFKLAQAIERWRARSIWVISRADLAYPSRLKKRLRNDAPALLYGCGEATLLEQGGLAVVGSRKASDSVLAFTAAVARGAAGAGRPIISGGARGIDQAAIDGSLDAGGWALAMLADSLEKAATRRAYRAALRDRRLVLVSPFDPAAGFNVGHAMQRNKFIYALADASLVVQAEVRKGGTWAGAMEQLERYRFAPLYVRSAPEAEPAATELERCGAFAWPEPADAPAWAKLFETPATSAAAAQGGLLEVCEEADDVATGVRDEQDSGTGRDVQRARVAQPDSPTRSGASDREVSAPREDDPNGVESRDEVRSEPESLHGASEPSKGAERSAELPGGGEQEADEEMPADALFEAVRTLLCRQLRAPKTEAEVADALAIQSGQAKAWLKRLVEEGAIEKRTRPVRYVIRDPALFE